MKNKIWSLLLSLALATSLWLYVITTVSPGSTATIDNVPVVFEGETFCQLDVEDQNIQSPLCRNLRI